MAPIDPDKLPKDIGLLQKLIVDLCAELRHESSEKNKFRNLLRELLEAQRNRKSEQLSKEQLALFETLWNAGEAEEPDADAESDEPEAEQAPEPDKPKLRSRRKPLARNVIRERSCTICRRRINTADAAARDLRLLGEEISERYEYVPASIKVIEDVRRKYTCDCTVKAAAKPEQPIAKSSVGASMLAQVIVSKFGDHQPLYRQEKIFERQGVRISRKTMGGWMKQVAELMAPLYEASKKVLFGSKVIGTDDTAVKVLDPKLPFARTGRIWPYLGDAHHPVVVHHYTPTRGRDGPARFLEGYKDICKPTPIASMTRSSSPRAG